MGICGYVDKVNITEDKTIFNMASRMTNSSHFGVKTYVNHNVALGCTTSNDINLNYINVPFSRIVDDKSYTIIYDGKLYNKEEIIQDLISKDYEFLTKSDAECILLLYIEYGNACLNIISGNFTFAIYDEYKSLIFLARDRLGIKPLFYTNSQQFIFSSEIKSILEHPNVHAKIGTDEICEIFGLGPAHTPGKTFFKDIFEILPGNYGIFKDDTFSMYQYWDLTTFDITDTIDESISKIKELVTNSVKKELIANTPVCSMLSGGLDSSILVSIAAKENPNLTTFSIDFKGNETNFEGNDYQPTRDSDFVKIMQEKFKTNHTNLYFSTEEIFSALKDVVIARDMPGMADVDSSMLVFLRKIKECGYDTVLSGECSDEIFGGYPWYYKEHLINSKNFPWSRSITTRANIINPNVVSCEYLENYIDNAFNKTSNSVVYNSTSQMENTFRKTCYNTVKWFMNTLVERTVRISMMSGLEVRVPFADYKIFEYVYNVSAKYKLGLVDGNETPVEKYLLRKAFEAELPKDIVYRKKSPFPKTYDPKYTLLLENAIKDIITKSSSPILEIINVKYLYEILEAHGENLKENWFGQLMTYPQTLAYLIQVNMWLEEYKIKIEI